jgi:hypothetical protein
VTCNDLTAFILARLDEDEQAVALFHELACPAQDPQIIHGHPGIWCRCPVPRQILRQVWATRHIIHACERHLPSQDTKAPGSLMTAAKIQRTLGAIALSYELHPQWREHWRP